MACILAGCTALAVVLWVALAHQHKRITRARAKAQQGALAGQLTALLPCIPIPLLVPCAVASQRRRWEAPTSAPLPHGLYRLQTCPFVVAEAAARRAALSLPVIIVQPDESAVFGAKLYRTPSGDMRWVQLS